MLNQDNPKKTRYFLPHDARSKSKIVISVLLAKEMARLLLKCDGIESWGCRNSLTVRINNGRKPTNTITISLNHAEKLARIFEAYETERCDCGSNDHKTKCAASKGAEYRTTLSRLMGET